MPESWSPLRDAFVNRRDFLRRAATAAAVGNAPLPTEPMNQVNQTLDGRWRLHPGTLPADWHSRSTDPTPWRDTNLPECWEKAGVPGAIVGPVGYRRTLTVPARAAGVRLFWECDAISYHARGYVNGAEVGAHTGLWDAFAWEIGPEHSGELRLAIEVEKPGSAQYPVRETMAGFLPYVWGAFGGPWQPMRLRATGLARIERVRAPATAAGDAALEVDLDLYAGAAAEIRATLVDPSGATVASVASVATTTGTATLALKVDRPTLWDTARPALYTLTVQAFVGGVLSDARERRIGFRDITVEGERILLNGRPVYFRAPLSWGWYESSMAPNPPDAVFEGELRRVRDLGFNGMKLCLWIPPERYFDLADRMGMLLWVELPIWLPDASQHWREQTPLEIRRIVDQRSDHPSIALWTIGCELGEGLDSAFLGELYREVKRQTGSPLVRDNSGSAECYGGPLPEHADYWDFHLYCDLPHARTTFDAFAPRWRERQPWLFGEFNDQDALRDVPAILKRSNSAPWWTLDDPKRNPKGVRWEYAVVQQEATLTRNGLLPRLAELKESSRKQALLARKHTLELTRSYPFTSGYVVTGLADTPISTAGIFDDFGAARATPEEMLPINGDTVLFLEPDRRRAWTAGGDRPSWLDRWGVWSGKEVRRHVGVSHFGVVDGVIACEWTCGDARGALPAVRIRPGDVAELGVLAFDAPSVTAPTRLEIKVIARLADGTVVRNDWPLWVFPVAAANGRTLTLLDPIGRLGDDAVFSTATGWRVVRASDGTGVIVSTRWSADLVAAAADGARVLYLQPDSSERPGADGLAAPPLPFFREAMRLFEKHGSWGDFPHGGATDFCFYGLASDCAFDLEALARTLGSEARLEPVLTRVDARTSLLHGYTVGATVGAGRMLLTTLRPYGGLGDQPSGLHRAVCGAYLLRCWLDALSR